MNTFQMRAVTSSNIAAVGYDPSGQMLIVDFKGSGSYIFDDVPPEIDDELCAIEREGGSVGKFFAARIRNRFTSTRLPAEEDTDTLPDFAAAAA